MPNAPVATISTRDLSEALGIEPRRIQQLAQEGIITKGDKRGEYLLITSVRCYCDYLRAMSTATPEGVPDLNEERAYHEAAKRRLAELELAIKEGRVIQTADAQAVWAKALTNFKQRLRSLATRLAAEWTMVRDNAEAQSLLQEAHDEVLADLSRAQVVGVES